MRARKSDQVRYSLKSSKSFKSDQSAIWEELESMACCLDAESPNMAMSEIFDKQAPTLQDYVKHFEPDDSQIGAIFMINGKVVALDCFGKAETFCGVFKKLVESYALDAIAACISKKTGPAAKKRG